MTTSRSSKFSRMTEYACGSGKPVRMNSIASFTKADGAGKFMQSSERCATATAISYAGGSLQSPGACRDTTCPGCCRRMNLTSRGRWWEAKALVWPCSKPRSVWFIARRFVPCSCLAIPMFTRPAITFPKFWPTNRLRWKGSTTGWYRTWKKSGSIPNPCNCSRTEPVGCWSNSAAKPGKPPKTRRARSWKLSRRSRRLPAWSSSRIPKRSARSGSCAAPDWARRRACRVKATRGKAGRTRPCRRKSSAVICATCANYWRIMAMPVRSMATLGRAVCTPGSIST